MKNSRFFNTLALGIIATGKGIPLPAFFLMVIVAVSLLALSTASRAQNGMTFEEANIFFELNHTDEDLGIHALVDGDAWKRLEIKSPNGSKILDVKAKNRLARQGLTEIFFESDEPSFEDLPPEQFFNRFPEGIYTFEAMTLEDSATLTIENPGLVSTDELKHVMPAPPDNIMISGVPAAEDCDADPLPIVSSPVVISWDAVETSHPDVGTPTSSKDIVIVNYQLVVEREEPTLLVFTVDLPPGQTSVTIPPELIALGTEFKLEIVVREESGNQTAVETCFEVEV